MKSSERLQYYFEQANAAELADEELKGADSRVKASWMLRRLEFYGWIEVETDKSYVQRVNFHEYAVKIIKILLEDCTTNIGLEEILHQGGAIFENTLLDVKKKPEKQQ